MRWEPQRAIRAAWPPARTSCVLSAVLLLVPPLLRADRVMFNGRDVTPKPLVQHAGPGEPRAVGATATTAWR